jgi:hypothetical protein
MTMLIKPAVRICWSLRRMSCSNMRRQPAGLMAGINPSSTNNKAKAIQMASDTTHSIRGAHEPYFFDEAGAVAPLPRMALKNSLLGSSTITSDLLRKVER